MTDVNKALSAIEEGDGRVSEEVLPLVCDEPRKLVAAKFGHKKPGQTLQATALGYTSRGRIRDWMQLVASGEAKLENSGRNLRPVWTEVPFPTRREFHLGR